MTAVISGGNRADARRNRAKVLAAAGEVFAEQGLGVPLGEIARRAGVGAGTVYRHFPSKQALLEAVFVQHLDELVASGERRMARSAPTEAFFGFLLDVVEKSDRRGPVCDVVAADASWPRPMLRASVLRFRQVLTALLHAARRAGGVSATTSAPTMSSHSLSDVLDARCPPRSISRPQARSADPGRSAPFHHRHGTPTLS